MNLANRKIIDQSQQKFDGRG